MRRRRRSNPQRPLSRLLSALRAGRGSNRRLAGDEGRLAGIGGGAIVGLERPGKPEVVTVEKRQIAAARLFTRRVTGGAGPAVGLAQHRDAGCRFQQHVCRLISRAVVDDQHFEIREALAEDGRQSLADQRRTVVGWDDD